MLTALEAPFAAIKPQPPVAAVEASRSDAAAVTGLVSNATKVTPTRLRIQIDRDANRVKRMRRAVGHSARLLHFDATGDHTRYRKTFITLTYRDADGWEPGHMGQFVRRLREWCKRRGIKCRFVWVAELQQRGALHYHLLTWIPRKFMVPKPDKRGWWTHGSSNIKEAQNAVSYIAKYASKTTTQQSVRYPGGARMHGCGGLDAEPRRHIRYWQAPLWVRDALTGRADIRKVNGGYCDKFTGEFLASPWKVEVTAGGMVFAWLPLTTEELDHENHSPAASH